MRLTGFIPGRLVNVARSLSPPSLPLTVHDKSIETSYVLVLAGKIAIFLSAGVRRVMRGPRSAKVDGKDRFSSLGRAKTCASGVRGVQLRTIARMCAKFMNFIAKVIFVVCLNPIARRSKGGCSALTVLLRFISCARVTRAFRNAC